MRIAGSGDELTLRTHLLDRADVYVDGRPRASADLTGESVTVSVPGAGAAHVIRVEGFHDGVLAAARTIVR